jgi:hypothetical protein
VSAATADAQRGAASNRGFWLVVVPVSVVGAALLILIFTNRPAAERASEFTARHNLRTSLAAARSIAERDGSFAAANTVGMRSEASDLAFTDPDLSSNNPDVISVYATDGLWAAAARAETGACFWIRTDRSGRVDTGRGSDCTGDAASSGRPVAWPSP